MICASLIALTFVSPVAPKDPASFLRWSMDRYKAMRSFQATAKWSMGLGTTATRTIIVQAPNRFKVVTDNGSGFKMTAVSDGKKMGEITNQSTNYFEAPSNIGRATTMLLQHPMFCGSVLYRFFLGGEELGQLASVRAHTILELPRQGKLRRIRFWGPSFYGTTIASIDPSTGLVHRIEYRSEPLLEQVKKQATDTAIDPKAMTTVEQYEGILVDRPIPASLFAVAGAPKSPVLPQSEAERPPFEIGSTAPEITLTGLDGKERKLSSFRGKPVLVDFWATWCPPCRATLPHTQKMHETYSAKGLQVFAVSDEDANTVNPFWLDKKYTFPTYLDPKSAAEQVYKIRAIPTFVILDAKGRLVDYVVGGGQDERIEAAVAKALRG